MNFSNMPLGRALKFFLLAGAGLAFTLGGLTVGVIWLVLR